MRVALLADVHANLHALETVLGEAHAAGCTALWMSGDWVGYGAFPEETVTLLRAAGAQGVAGDMDREVVAAAAGSFPPRAPEAKRQALSWTATVLSPGTLAFLAGLPEQRRVRAGEGEAEGVLLVHGSPAALQEHLWPDTDRQRLLALAALAGAPLVVCGHTHAAMDRSAGGCRFLNPGSVGRPGDGDPRAGWALLELGAGQGVATAAFSARRVVYDHEAAASAVLDRGLPAAVATMLRAGKGLKAVLEDG